MLKIKKINKSYGSMTVLSDISFSFERGQKAALVGPNGVGKTTLLQIIAGIEEPDSGNIETVKGTRVGYLPQDTSLAGDETISAYLKRISGIDVWEEYRIEILLSGFGFNKTDTNKKLSDLSSGEKSKVALIGILLKGADLLLLDEPTNNLDLPALIWLEDFLRKSEAAVLVVSHDRKFLDRTVRKIFELDWQSRTLTITNGAYSDFLETKRKQFERQKQTYRLQQEEIKRLTKQAREKKIEASRGARWVGTDSDKFLRGFKRDRASKSGRTAKAIEKRIDQMEKVEKPIEREPLEIPLEAERNSGVLDIRLIKLVAGYADGFRIGPISLELRYGNRVNIMGLNGSGKTTLLKTIVEQLVPLAGRVEIGSGVRTGNLMQEHELLSREKTPLSFLRERAGLSERDSYAKLAKFGLDEKRATNPIANLSPGERARLLFACFSALSVNVLLLDEPTNHLDLEALDALEEMLKTYKGTVLLVSHDRYLLERTSPDFTYVLSDGVLNRIADYREYVSSAEKRARKLLRLL